MAAHPPVPDSPEAVEQAPYTATERLDPDTLKEVVAFVLLAVGVAAALWGIDREWGRAWACMIGGIACAIIGLALLPKAHIPKDTP